MNRLHLSIALIVFNILLFAWLAAEYAIPAGAAYLAVLASIAASALSQRFLPVGYARARSNLDLPVVITSLLAFDVVIALGIAFGHHG